MKYETAKYLIYQIYSFMAEDVKMALDMALEYIEKKAEDEKQNG